MNRPRSAPYRAGAFALLAGCLLVCAPALANDYGAAADDDDPMGGFGLGLRAGVELRGARDFGSLTRNVLREVDLEGNINNAAGVDVGIDPLELLETNEPFRMPAAESLVLGVALNFGTVVYYRLEPNVVLGDFTQFNAYNGLGFNLHFGPVYLGFGIGGQVGYLVHERLNWGVSLSGRVPVNLYVYLAEDFALFLEVGGSLGVEIVQVGTAQDVSTASSEALDISLGMRFP